MTERYLLDTNAVSITREPRKNPAVAALLSGLDRSSLWLSVLTLGEVRRGITVKRRRHGDVNALERWADQLEKDYADQTLGVDLATAKLWGSLTATRTHPQIGTLIAATAIVHGLTVVTRNVKDYEDLPVKLLNPWQPA